MLDDVAPDGMKPYFEGCCRIVVPEKHAGGILYTHIKEGDDQRFLVLKIDVQGAGSDVGFFSHGLHGETGEAIGLDEFEGGLVDLVDLIFVFQFHITKINELLFIYGNGGGQIFIAFV